MLQCFPLGTGKSEGFFSLMVQLNGATKLGSQQTAASFRDSMAANRSGIVWIDDLDDATKVYQDIRTATNESFRSKKGLDNFGSVSVKLVAPVLLTGESLPGLSDQTALLDRLIRLDVPAAKGRRSLHGEYEQWDDILALKARHPELWRISGWYVQEALRHCPSVVAQWSDLRPKGVGRHGDKLAVLRVGARLLDLMTGDGWHSEIVDEWCNTQAAPEGDYLVNRILPEILRRERMPRAARPNQPVFVDELDQVWWCPTLVADWWADHYKFGDARTQAFGHVETLNRHKQSMGITKAHRKKFAANDRGEKYGQKDYYPVPMPWSAHVIDRAMGE